MGRAKLQPGEDTIKSVTPRKTETGYELRWRVRDFEGRLYAKRTQARTVGEARRRAFEKAEQIKRATSDATAWTPADSITDFIDREVEPAIKEKRLSKASRARYLEVMAHYRRYTRGMSISAATSASSLIRTLKDISKEIGPETAR